VLFVCVQNAGRSQMAMGLMNELSGGRVHVRSAGSMPASDISATVITAMDNIGIDITSEFPKPLTDDVVQAADVVITMGCGDACPVYPGKRYIDWNLPDPDGMSIEGVAEVRELIREHVQQLLAELVPQG
jgi:arsenate reductase